MTEQLFINGAWVAGEGEAFSSLNPATGEVVWEGHEASSAQIDAAVTSGLDALPAWANRPLEERQAIIEAFAKVVESHKEELASLISREVGKPQWETLQEVAAMIGKAALSIEAYHNRTPTSEREAPGGRLVTRHRPHGLVGILGPFNFPAHLPNGHIIPALLAGNVLLFKPSEVAPAVGAQMVAYWDEAGLPPGVLNLIQGGRDAGEGVATHPQLNGLFFTGSAETAHHLSQLYAPHPEKILALEGGGNNPLIVSNISDLEAAAYLTIQSAYITSGQRCTCARRLIVVGEQQPFIDKLVEAIGTIKVGPPTDDPEPFISSVISPAAAERLLAVQEGLIERGGEPLVTMRSLKEGTGMVTPGLIDVTALTEKEDREIFGPLLRIIRVDTFEEALKEANATRYGLSAGLLSESRDQWNAFLKTIRAGIVNWNSPTTGASGAAPFGGIGISGNHRPSAYYAADYCAYPVASVEKENLTRPELRGVGS